MVTDRLKGINISSELVLMNIVDIEDLFVSFLPLLHAIKKNRINSPFLSTVFSDTGKSCVSACFTREDILKVQELIQNNDSLKAGMDIIHGVGLLSVYPHRSSLPFLGISLSALSNAGLPVLGMSSSISSLIFVLQYSHLGKAVDSLKGCFSSTEKDMR